MDGGFMRRYAKVTPGIPKNLLVRASSDTGLMLVLGGAKE